MDHRLIDLLVCPLCKSQLTMLRDAEQRPQGLACKADRLLFPIRDGIPVMLESEAQPLPEAGDSVSPPLPDAGP